MGIVKANEQSFEAFEQFFLNLRGRSGGNITTKTAGDISSCIVGTLYGGITDKIDPVTVGEMQRAVDIAVEYGKRLGVAPAIVNHLVKEYPSHGFIIDYEEALTLFPNSRCVTPSEYELLSEVCSILYTEFGENYTITPHTEGILAHIQITEEAIKNAKDQLQVHNEENKTEQPEKSPESSPEQTKN